METNIELKKEHCKKLLKKYEDLGVNILRFDGLGNDNKYYFTIIELNNAFYLKAQCDLDNDIIYAYSLIEKNENTSLCIYITDILLCRIINNKDFYIPKFIKLKKILENIYKDEFNEEIYLV